MLTKSIDFFSAGSRAQLDMEEAKFLFKVFFLINLSNMIVTFPECNDICIIDIFSSHIQLFLHNYLSTKYTSEPADLSALPLPPV